MQKSSNPERKLEVGVKALIQRDQKYLFLKRAEPYPKENFCRWDIPGGRIVPGEELETALTREIQEETTMTFKKVLKILAAQDILRVETKHTVRITYAVSATGHIQLNTHEHSAFKWLTLQEVLDYPLDLYLKSVIESLIHKNNED